MRINLFRTLNNDGVIVIFVSMSPEAIAYRIMHRSNYYRIGY